jgi:UDP-N-acetylglucosamine 1-carboxyvinyltransferase
MAAVLAKGTTVVDNVAREPEIVDLCEMLNKMGAQISGIGTSTLEITGVSELSPTTHEVVTDRIVAGTWAAAAVITQGEIFIRNAKTQHMELVISKIEATGAQVKQLAEGLQVTMSGRPQAVDIMTLPYPGFPYRYAATIYCHQRYCRWHRHGNRESF